MTGDSTLDRFSHYNYAPSRPLRSANMASNVLVNGQMTSERIQAVAANIGGVFAVGLNHQQALPPGFLGSNLGMYQNQNGLSPFSNGMPMPMNRASDGNVNAPDLLPAVDSADSRL